MSLRTHGALATLLLLAAWSPAPALEDGWKGRAELSYVRTGGNTDAETLAGKLKGSYEREANRYFLKAASLRAKADGKETSNRWLAEGRYERGLTERLFAFLEGSYLKDEFAGFDSRIQVGPGLGHDLVKSERHRLRGLASLLYTWDNDVDGGTDSYATGKLAGDYSWEVLADLTFQQHADYLASLEDSDVYFANSETGLELKVNAAVSLGMSYALAYQNEPPRGADHVDRTFLTSLLVDF